MSIEQQLTDALTQAIRAKDIRTADVVRMLKTRLQERRTAKGFAGQVDDALVLDVIAAYRKQLQKALAEYDKLGERGAAQAAQLRFEIEFCRQHIAHFKCPAAVEFGELPKTSTGKVQKFVLRDREWKGRAKRIN